MAALDLRARIRGSWSRGKQVDEKNLGMPFMMEGGFEMIETGMLLMRQEIDAH